MSAGSGCRARFLIRGRDGKFPEPSGAVLVGAGITVVRTGARMLRINALTERRARSCRRGLPGRTLVWNQHHLLRALCGSRASCNHRLHQGIADAGPLRPLPPPITDPGQIAHLDIR